MALTKQSFGIVVTTLTQWWSPTIVRISGDESVKGQLRQTEDGRVECHFPDRMVMIANHQVHTLLSYVDSIMCRLTRNSSIPTGFTSGG